MSKFSKLGLRRAAGAVAIAAAAVVGITSMGAGAASAQKLADGYKSASGIDGETVQVWRKAEYGSPIRTVANNPASRGAWLTGTYQGQASKGVDGNLAVKLIVGCQVDVSGITLDLSGVISLSAASFTGGLSLPIGPGQVAVVDITDKDFKDGKVAVQIQDFPITLNACGGYASARSAVKVIAAKGYNTDGGTVNGEGTLIQSTLYGQPFTLN